jgi:hypothetical protein
LTWGTGRLPQESQLNTGGSIGRETGDSLGGCFKPGRDAWLSTRLWSGQVWRDGELLTTVHWGRSAHARELFFYLLEHYQPQRRYWSEFLA